MISNELKKKQTKQLLKDEVRKILDKDQGTFLKIKDITEFTEIIKSKIKNPLEDKRFFDLKDDQIESVIIEVLLANKTVKLYRSSEQKISVNNFLDIEKDKYILYMAKIYGLISNKRIEDIFLQMPEKIRKNYAMKKLNKEAFNKNVRFAKENIKN